MILISLALRILLFQAYNCKNISYVKYISYIKASQFIMCIFKFRSIATKCSLCYNESISENESSLIQKYSTCVESVRMQMHDEFISKSIVTDIVESHNQATVELYIAHLLAKTNIAIEYMNNIRIPYKTTKYGQTAGTLVNYVEILQCEYLQNNKVLPEISSSNKLTLKDAINKSLEHKIYLQSQIKSIIFPIISTQIKTVNNDCNFINNCAEQENRIYEKSDNNETKITLTIAIIEYIILRENEVKFFLERGVLLFKRENNSSTQQILNILFAKYQQSCQLRDHNEMKKKFRLLEECNFSSELEKLIKEHIELLDELLEAHKCIQETQTDYNFYVEKYNILTDLIIGKREEQSVCLNRIGNILLHNMGLEPEIFRQIKQSVSKYCPVFEGFLNKKCELYFKNGPYILFKELLDFEKIHNDLQRASSEKVPQGKILNMKKIDLSYLKKGFIFKKPSIELVTLKTKIKFNKHESLRRRFCKLLAEEFERLFLKFVSEINKLSMKDCEKIL